MSDYQYAPSAAIPWLQSIQSSANYYPLPGVAYFAYYDNVRKGWVTVDNTGQELSFKGENMDQDYIDWMEMQGLDPNTGQPYETAPQDESYLFEGIGGLASQTETIQPQPEPTIPDSVFIPGVSDPANILWAQYWLPGDLQQTAINELGPIGQASQATLQPLTEEEMSNLLSPAAAYAESAKKSNPITDFLKNLSVGGGPSGGGSAPKAASSMLPAATAAKSQLIPGVDNTMLGIIAIGLGLILIK